MGQEQVDLARRYGTDAGRDAAGWVFDGNTSVDTCQRFLRLWDDGGPELDGFSPSSGWLSGEWSGTTVPLDVIGLCGLETDDEGHATDVDLWDLCCTEYEDAADIAYWGELERIAILQARGDE